MTDTGPYLSAWAECRVCAYRWICITPVDGELSNLECPKCHTMSGEIELPDDV